MTVVTDRRMTLRDFLTYDDGTGRRYELVDGILVEMASESTINTLIAAFLVKFFFKTLEFDEVGFKQKIEVTSSHATARDPDLIIHSEDSATAIQGRAEACLFLNEPNPRLVIEVVSPGDETTLNYQRDYLQKPREYANRGIPEMWQIDPSRDRVRVLILEGRIYRVTQFMGQDTIVSPTFPTLNLTASQVLSPKRLNKIA